LAAPRGHGKNSLLLAGLTAETVLDLIAGNRQEPLFPSVSTASEPANYLSVYNWLFEVPTPETAG
jgi:hypothetical protein